MTSHPWLRRTLLTLTAAAVVYGVVLRFPQAVFAYSTQADNVVLHARSPEQRSESQPKFFHGRHHVMPVTKLTAAESRSQFACSRSICVRPARVNA